MSLALNDYKELENTWDNYGRTVQMYDTDKDKLLKWEITVGLHGGKR